MLFLVPYYIKTNDLPPQGVVRAISKGKWFGRRRDDFQHEILSTLWFRRMLMDKKIKKKKPEVNFRKVENVFE